MANQGNSGQGYSGQGYSNQGYSNQPVNNQANYPINTGVPPRGQVTNQATLVYVQNQPKDQEYFVPYDQPPQKTHQDYYQPPVDQFPINYEPLRQSGPQAPPQEQYVEPAPPIVIQQPPPPPATWQREHKDWSGAKGCYIFALLMAILLLIGLALIWPTILVARHIYRLDHATYLQRLRFLNDDITFYDEALTNNARLCALRTSERKWGDSYVSMYPMLQQTFTDLSSQKNNFASKFVSTTAAANSQLITIEQQAVSKCGAALAPATTANTAGDVFSSNYASLKGTFRAGVNLDGRDTEQSLLKQQTELVGMNWNLWVALYVAVGVCGTALAFMAAAYGNLTTKAHRAWDVGAYGNKPNTAALGEKQKLCAFFTFFTFTVAAATCFALENSGSRYIAYNDDIYRYGHELNNIRYYDEVLSGNARLCAEAGDLRYKERYLVTANLMDDSLMAFEELLTRLTNDYGSKGDWWDPNMRLLTNIKNANIALIEWGTTVMSVCSGGSGSTVQLNLPFTTQYQDQKNIISDNLKRLTSNLQRAMDDNNGAGSNALRHGYRGATIAMTIFASLVAFAFFLLMMKLVNERWQSKTPGAAVQHSAAMF